MPKLPHNRSCSPVQSTSRPGSGYAVGEHPDPLRFWDRHGRPRAWRKAASTIRRLEPCLSDRQWNQSRFDHVFAWHPPIDAKDQLESDKSELPPDATVQTSRAALEQPTRLPTVGIRRRLTRFGGQ